MSFFFALPWPIAAPDGDPREAQPMGTLSSPIPDGGRGGAERASAEQVSLRHVCSCIYEPMRLVRGGTTGSVTLELVFAAGRAIVA